MEATANFSLRFARVSESKLETPDSFLSRQVLQRIATRLSLVSQAIGFSILGILIIMNRHQADPNGLAGGSAIAMIGGISAILVGRSNSDEIMKKILIIEGQPEMRRNLTTILQLENGNFVPVRWSDWLKLEVRPEDDFIGTPRSRVRAPRVIIAVNFNKFPLKRPRLTLKQSA